MKNGSAKMAGCGSVLRGITSEMYRSSAYDERYEFDPIISELASRVIAIEVIWNSRV